MKGYFNEIAIMKAIAIFLITWFHFQGYVPNYIKALFVGGALGNSIFFYCSGYLLAIKKENFRGEWFLRKYLRVMPSVWVFCLIVDMAYLLFSQHMPYKWNSFIYPTPFWFINAILCFFIVTYILSNLLPIFKDKTHYRGGDHDKMILAIALVAMTGNTLYYFTHEITPGKVTLEAGGLQIWFFYFIFFIWGYWEKLKGRNKSKSSVWAIVYVMGSIILFHGYKLLASKIEALHLLQFILVPSLLALVILAFRSFAEWFIEQRLSNRTKEVITWLSNNTLDIYVVQVFLIHLLAPYMTFPINIIMFIMVILAAAIINHFLATKIQRFINKTIDGLIKCKTKGVEV